MAKYLVQAVAQYQQSIVQLKSGMCCTVLRPLLLAGAVSEARHRCTKVSINICISLFHQFDRPFFSSQWSSPPTHIWGTRLELRRLLKRLILLKVQLVRIQLNGQGKNFYLRASNHVRHRCLSSIYRTGLAWHNRRQYRDIWQDTEAKTQPGYYHQDHHDYYKTHPISLWNCYYFH